MMRVGLLWRGDAQAAPPDPETTRLRGVFDALSQRDVEAIPIVYADEVVDRYASACSVSTACSCGSIRLRTATIDRSSIRCSQTLRRAACGSLRIPTRS